MKPTWLARVVLMLAQLPSRNPRDAPTPEFPKPSRPPRAGLLFPSSPVSKGSRQCFSPPWGLLHVSCCIARQRLAIAAPKVHDYSSPAYDGDRPRWLRAKRLPPATGKYGEQCQAIPRNAACTRLNACGSHKPRLGKMPETSLPTLPRGGSICRMTLRLVGRFLSCGALR
jgi:hypothetical protein